MMRQKIILLDIDGTLVPKSLEQWFLEFLFSQQLVRHRDVLLNVSSLIIQKSSLQWHYLKLAYLRGSSKQQVQDWINTCWATVIAPQLYNGMIQAVQWFQSVGFQVILLSGTPRPLALPLIELLKISDTICAEPELINDIYTGSLIMPHPRGTRKVASATDWLISRSLNWSQVCVIADHWQDRFLLSRANHAIVVCPEKKLRRFANRKSFLIIDEPDNPEEIIFQIGKYLHFY